MTIAYVKEPLEKLAMGFGLSRLIFSSIDEKEREPIRLGSGACKSCDCKGYKKGKESGYCGNCGHGYSQHR